VTVNALSPNVELAVDMTGSLGAMYTAVLAPSDGLSAVPRNTARGGPGPARSRAYR
jgi:hypothetical protein